MSVGVEVDDDVVVDLVVGKGKEAHGGQTPSYTRKPWWWMLKWSWLKPWMSKSSWVACVLVSLIVGCGADARNGYGCDVGDGGDCAAVSGVDGLDVEGLDEE